MRAAFSAHGRLMPGVQRSMDASVKILHAARPRFAGKISDEFTARLNEIYTEEAKKTREYAIHVLSQTFLSGVNHHKLLQLIEELQEQKTSRKTQEYEQKLLEYNRAGFFKRLLNGMEPPRLQTALTVFDVMETFHPKESVLVIHALRQLRAAKVLAMSSFEYRLPAEDEQKFRSYGLWSTDIYEASRTIAVTPLGKELADGELKSTGSEMPLAMKPYDPDSNFPGE
jgi:hypothetical protein